jgi:hypothetical protein
MRIHSGGRPDPRRINQARDRDQRIDSKQEFPALAQIVVAELEDFLQEPCEEPGFCRFLQCAPKGADHQWGKDPLKLVVGRT